MGDTTRRWPSAAQMAAKLMTRVAADNPSLNPVLAASIEASLTTWFTSGGHTEERKTSRLTEKLKDSIEIGAFGPMFEADGTTHTQAGEIWKAFDAIYSVAFLAQFDEEGQLL